MLSCRLTNTQFSQVEIWAIVEEAQACGTYVCAHAYTAQAIKRAVECGVRSIEHGNLLDEETAGEDGVHVVGFVVMGAG
jgi:imidazolonepropionase-like amidohydrolase